tara:strand:+ start:113 stop:799 length:687 start_codon:yes stop_codon:yes gene_type:complete
MTVKLISYSQPSDIFIDYGQDDREHLNNLEKLVAFCARVSNPDNQHNDKTAEKLLKYLIKHKHWSPFEMVSACLEIGTTRDIARQILRHRSFSFQEYSQRYADPTEDLNFRMREARLQDNKNRQNSIEVNNANIQANWKMRQSMVMQEVFEAYNWAINAGIAKEQARAVLPEGNTKSKLYMNGTIRSWIHYIGLRSGPETQKEHREIAVECANAIEPVFPMIIEFISE